MKKITFIFLFCVVPLLHGQTTSPANTHLLREATIPEFVLEQSSLSDAIDALRESTKKGELQVNFLVTPEAAELNTPVTLDLRGINGMDAFATILRITKTRAEIRRNIIWILPNP